MDYIFYLLVVGFALYFGWAATAQEYKIIKRVKRKRDKDAKEKE